MCLTLTHRSGFAAPKARAKQRGVVMLVALIILVALTLAGVALIRAVDTSNLIAGNMSFRESAVHAGERSTELAIANWLKLHNVVGDAALFNNNAANGYRAVRADPAAGVTIEAYWNTTLAAQAVTGAPDAAGNRVSYVIHRLCDATGAPHLVNCSKPPSSLAGGGHQAGQVGTLTTPQVYYRVTTRIVGPRNTVAYLQTILALSL